MTVVLPYITADSPSDLSNTMIGEGNQPTPYALAISSSSRGMDTPVALVEGVTATAQVAGVRFDCLRMPQVVRSIGTMGRRMDKPRYVCTGNLDHLALLHRDRNFRRIYDEADLVIADGMPVVWLSQMAHWRSKKSPALPERVAGSDLFFELGQLSAATSLRLFYLGGLPGSAEQAAEIVRARFPGAIIAGTYCPPFETFGTEAETTEIVNRIHSAAPHILMVGLGAPKQEKWIAANRLILQVPVSIGVGSSFEMACGMVRRAPLWMQRTGLEWMYRLLQEPRRLWKRYFGRDLPFLIRVTLATLFQPTRAGKTRQ